MDRRNTHLRCAVFIDRDGTLSEEVGYINHPSRFRLFPFAAKAIRRLNEAGWLAVLVTNQAGVARGYFTEDLLLEVHRMLQDALEKQGAHLDAIYYCPHHPAAGKPPYKLDCDCRKPKPGLIHRAARELEIDLQRSWMIGDRYSDVELARNAGVRAAFVLTGYGLGEWEYQRDQWKQMPDLVAADLGEAVERIILFDEQKRLESR
ncbi:MAG: D,D-heptose 1,7-bisphosphate phosphatase [Pyrinomonas sp.]|mgnify:CR=1 FL=1|uniref:D-glycero-alpha-D-manno-heptose-1,7-bisphosphate 7-phosphatase n=1 Tax=Pyrinomonas sp. TaxID=2080306 RepID=UPI0033264AC7